MQTSIKKMTRLDGVCIARISTVPFFVVAQLKYQIETLSNLNAQVIVVCGEGTELECFKEMKNVRSNPINIPRGISPLRDLYALYELYIFFRGKRVQIAHSTTPKAGLLTAIAAYLANVPVRVHTFTGQPWVNMRGIKRWLAYSGDKVMGRLNTRCYADSASQRQFLIDKKIVESSRISVIGAGSLAGVDIRRFNRNRFSQDESISLKRAIGIPDASKVLLFVGRITFDKGITELLQAFSMLKQLGSTAHLIFVGHFDLESGVAGAISKNQIHDVCDTHIMDYSASPECYFAIADILCLPSYREGFGTVVIEAAAMGVPTVGTDIYGLSDAIVHGETGLLVPLRDAALLASALDTLLSDELMRLKMGILAMQRAYALFDADQVNLQVAQEYLALLGKSKV